MTIEKMPSEERPREKLLKEGVSTLSNAELIAILLHTGTKDRTVLELAGDVLSADEKGILFLGECTPEELQQISDDILAARIKNALELGLKLAERDKSFVKPNFSGKYRGIAWLMPLHLNSSFTDDPELVLVVSKMGEFYEIKTILPYDDGVKDRITAMTLYSKLW